MREVAFELAPLPSDQLKLSGPAPDAMVEVLVITNAFDPRGWMLLLMVNEALGTSATITSTVAESLVPLLAVAMSFTV